MNKNSVGEVATENSALIVAAPELLAVCELLLADLHWSEDRGWVMGPFADPQSPAGQGGVIELLRAAVAKANEKDSR